MKFCPTALRSGFPFSFKVNETGHHQFSAGVQAGHQVVQPATRRSVDDVVDRLLCQSGLAEVGGSQPYLRVEEPEVLSECLPEPYSVLEDHPGADGQRAVVLGEDMAQKQPELLPHAQGVLVATAVASTLAV